LGLLWLWLPYRIWPSPLWLLGLQSATSAAAAIPIEALARHVTGSPKSALVCAGALLLTPQLLNAEIYDFHSLTLCALPMALMVWAIERDRVAGVAIAAALALSLREQMGLAVAGAGLAWAMRHGWRERGLHAAVLGTVGLSVFLLEVLWAIPAFAG